VTIDNVDGSKISAGVDAVAGASYEIQAIAGGPDHYISVVELKPKKL
jgi:hypothetical protein